MQEMKLHFQRFEFKYLLSWQEFREIRSRLKQYVSLDGFAKNSMAGFYEVISLYYDSPKFYYYYEKIDGVKIRKKIRLRAYRVDGVWAGHTFFEIKRKCDAVILKDRFLMTDGVYHDFIRNRNFVEPGFMPDKNAQRIIEEYEYERCRRSLQPQILVSYCREPYLGRFNKNFRVTFDYNIKAKASRELLDTSNSRDVLTDGVVMEIKFNGQLPYYIREIVESYNLERSAYSKYCRAAEACHILPDLNFSSHYFFKPEISLLTQY